MGQDQGFGGGGGGGGVLALRLSNALRLLRMGVSSAVCVSVSCWLSCSSSFISASRSSLAASSNSPSGQTSHSGSHSSGVALLVPGGFVRASTLDRWPVPKKSIPPFFVLTRFVQRKPIKRSFNPGISRSSFVIMGSEYVYRSCAVLTAFGSMACRVNTSYCEVPLN